MKRLFIYMSMAAALLAVSCQSERLSPEPGAPGTITLKLRCGDMNVKSAGTETESVINYFDYFFFSDAEGTDLLHQGRASGDTESFDTTTDEYSDLQKKSYVYVLANYPGDIPATVTTLAALKELPVITNFNNATSFVMDTYTPEIKDTETGEVTQEESYMVEIKPSGIGTAVTVPLDLTRLAVKFTLTMNIAKEISGPAEGEKWNPIIDTDHFFAYFVNALDSASVDAQPILRKDNDPDLLNAQKRYFTYDTKSSWDQTDGTDSIKVVSSAFYSYPQAWESGDNGEPYFKIQMPWNSTLSGTSQLYYKILVPHEVTEGKFTVNRNTWYHLTANIVVLGGTIEDFVLSTESYCVADFAPWSAPKESSGAGLSSATFFDVPTLVYNVYSSDTLDIFFRSNVSAYAEIRSITYNDYKPTDGSLFKPVTVTPSSGNTHQSNYNHQTEGRNYKVESSPIAPEDHIRFTHDMSNLYVLRDIVVRIYKSESGNFESQYANVYKDVTIHQHPAIELKKQAAGDVFVNGYFARVANAASGTYVDYQTIDGTRYYYSRNVYGNDPDLGGNTHSFSTSYGTITDGGNVDQTISRAFYTTDITITAFNNDNNHYTANNQTVYYKIGDPRTASNWSSNSLSDYYKQNTRPRTAAWSDVNKILICSTDTTDRRVISPRFLVSSALNAMSDGLTFSNAQKRAATYQEAGYPAGRWRLPTEAEIAFIVARQKDNTVPELFASNNTYYWAGSGRRVQVSSSNSISFTNAGNNDTAYLRFVYDLWYWGEAPDTPNVYHPTGHTTLPQN